MHPLCVTGSRCLDHARGLDVFTKPTKNHLMSIAICSLSYTHTLFHKQSPPDLYNILVYKMSSTNKGNSVKSQCTRSSQRSIQHLSPLSPPLAPSRGRIIHCPLEFPSTLPSSSAGYEPAGIKHMAALVCQLVTLIFVGEDDRRGHGIQAEGMVVFPQCRAGG